MTNFILAHIGAAVLLEAALTLAGYDVFDDTKTENGGLIDTSKHRTRVYSYVVLLDYCSKALAKKLREPESIRSFVSKIKEVAVRKTNTIKA